MESPQNLLNQSIKEAKISEYIVSITNKLIKDKKIMVSILSHLKKSFMLAINGFLINEKIKGNMKNVFSDESLILNYFFENYAKKLNVDIELKSVFFKVLKSMNAYDSRGIILEKNNNYVFITNDYELLPFSFDEIKKFIKITLDFSKKIENEIIEKKLVS